MIIAVSLQNILNTYQGLGPLVMVLVTVWALAHCFIGRVLFRALLLGDALVAGGLLGAALLGAFHGGPGGMDFFVAASAGVVLLGTLAWVAGRLAFAMLSGLAAGLLLLAMAGWILAVLVGILIACVAHTTFRQAAAFACALCGALGAVVSSAALVAGRVRLWDYVFGDRYQLWLGLLLAVLVAALTAAGMFAQRQLMLVIRTSLTPEHILRLGQKKGPTIRLRLS
jgi:hypothetical protein